MQLSYLVTAVLVAVQPFGLAAPVDVEKRSAEGEVPAPAQEPLTPKPETPAAKPGFFGNIKNKWNSLGKGSKFGIIAAGAAAGIYGVDKLIQYRKSRNNSTAIASASGTQTVVAPAPTSTATAK